MKVLLINGSPHKDGCTNRTLEEIIKVLHEENIETELIHVGNIAVRGCIACGSCHRTHSEQCVFKDDGVNKAIELFKSCDGLIIGSPVYYASPNGQLISFLDRMFYASSGHENKLGAAVVSCRRAGSTASLDALNKYFTIYQMPIVSSCYWNMVHGNTKEEVEQDVEGLQVMRQLGRNMAWLLKSIELGKKNGLEKPKQEKRNYTNFIR